MKKITYLLLCLILILSLFSCNTQPTEQTPPEQPTQPQIEVGNTNKTDISWIDPNRPVVALTFDDGPFTWGSSIEVYEYLAEQEIHATFFLLGQEIETQKKAINLIKQSGSQIANHTYSHKNLTKLTPEQIKEEEQKVIDILNSHGANEDRYLVRVPYGAYDQKVLDAISAPIILWNKDSVDYSAKTAQEIIDNIGEVSDGDIILMHDIHQVTADALKILVPQLRAQGFQFVTIDEMFEFKGIELEAGKVYFSGN